MFVRLSLDKNYVIALLLEYAPFICLMGTFLVNVCLFWPGQMTEDSHAQYQAAISGIYGDHHPPIMSVLWRIFNLLHTGSGLLFFFHLCLFYLAALIFMLNVPGIARWFYTALPLIPPLCFYSAMIWKDIGFAFAYLLAMALLSSYLLREQKPGSKATLSILTLLFYGTAVKFQALYILPVPLLGLSYCYTRLIISYKTILYTICTYALCMIGIQSFNAFYILPEGRSHSWQLVKIYDLAAISLLSNQQLFPAFILGNSRYSFDSVKTKFNHERVDDLVGFPDSPLHMGITDQERFELFTCWRNAVISYPHYYLYHRFCNWWRMVNAIPIARLDTLDFSKYGGLRWFCTIQHAATLPVTMDDGISQLLMIIMSKLFFALFAILRYALRISLLLPFLFCYLLLGILRYRKHVAAMPLILLNSISIAMLITLFFFSMASTIRYMYIVICMVHASHGLAYWCLFSKKSY